MSLITIKNNELSVTLDSFGAVLSSIRKDGCEYLWQGDPKYWKAKDYNLFPYVGRLTDNSYYYRHKKYTMQTHGFCRRVEFEVEFSSENSVCFAYRSSEETRASFPFDFIFRVEYILESNKIIKHCKVSNYGKNEMFFGLGSHPGFNVPLEEGSSFEDWYLDFEEESHPVQIEFNPENIRLTGRDYPYELKDGRYLPLQHSLFNIDAVVLQHMPKSVAIRSEKSSRSVRVSFPDMNFVGIWHAPKTDAPYVCIEPWLSLPSHSAYIESFEEQEYLASANPGEEYINTITIEIQ